MKYEMIFGDPSLFDEADRSIDLIRYNKKIGLYFQDSLKNLSGSLLEQPIVAMRRIIQEPKRWTVEDRKAGRLPEVGDIVLLAPDMVDVEFVGKHKVLPIYHFRRGDGYMGYCAATCIKPLETPEEKAERLRSEWCHAALRLINDELSDACDAAVIYDALLSGALSVPTKGGE